jgi:N-terminal domain of (some) glycogen debranching enzymes
MVDAGQPWLHNLVTVLSAPTMVLSDQDGQLRRAGAQDALHAHSRVLAQAVLEINGAEPAALSSGLVSADTALFTSVPRQTATDAADPAAWITRQRTVRPGVVQELVRVTGGPRASGTAAITLRVAADLADLADIKAGRARPLAPMTATSSGLEWSDHRLTVQLSAPGAVATGWLGLRRRPLAAPGLALTRQFSPSGLQRPHTRNAASRHTTWLRPERRAVSSYPRGDRHERNARRARRNPRHPQGPRRTGSYVEGVLPDPGPAGGRRSARAARRPGVLGREAGPGRA